MDMMENNNQSSDYNANISTSYNPGFQSASALQIRLDTSRVVSQIEMYLKGRREEIYADKDGAVKTRFVHISKPLLNDEGIQWLMNFIENVINVQSVQGNFSDYEEYSMFLERTRKDLAEHLMINIYNYGLKESNYGGLISTLMRLIETFFSRLIGNEERNSYASTIKSIESNSIRPAKSGFNLPFSKG